MVRVVETWEVPGTAMAAMQGLSSLVWALAVAGVRPSGAWLSEFWAVLDHQLEHQRHELRGHEVANIFWWVVSQGANCGADSLHITINPLVIMLWELSMNEGWQH